MPGKPSTTSPPTSPTTPTPTSSRASSPRAIREFGGYLAANACAIPNYGERYRAGETISTSFVESAVNQVISKRMVK